MPAQIVDKFNVDGQDYEIEPPMDAVPTEGSLRAVQSGGVYSELIATRGDTPVASGPNAQGAFTRKGAYDFFSGATDAKSWLTKAFGNRLFSIWKVCSGFPDNFAMTALYKANGLYVCGGMARGSYDPLGFWWSEDGKNWTKGTITQGYSDVTPSCIMYANGIWVAGTSRRGGEIGPTLSPGYNIWWSEDGKTWNIGSGIATGLAGVISSIAYGNNIWVALKYESNSTAGIYWSEDGKIWTHCQTVSSANSVLFANGMFVACASHVWQSTNGKTWTDCGSYGGGKVEYVGGRWFTSGGRFSSSDGVNWVTNVGLVGYITSVGHQMSVQYVGGRYITLGKASDYTSFAYYSDDGVNWTAGAFNDADFTGTTDHGANAIYSANGIVVINVQGKTASGGGTAAVGYICYSSDFGVSWHIAASPHTHKRGVAYLYSKYGSWMFSGIDSELYWSVDGGNWGPCDIVGNAITINHCWGFFAFDDIVYICRDAKTLYADLELLLEEGLN